MINRRGLITGLISFIAAPPIVRASSLMPVKSFVLPDNRDKILFPMTGNWRVCDIINFSWDDYKQDIPCFVVRAIAPDRYLEISPK